MVGWLLHFCSLILYISIREPSGHSNNIERESFTVSYGQTQKLKRQSVDWMVKEIFVKLIKR